MDDLIKWEPRDNQHLTAMVENLEMMSGTISVHVGRCPLCDGLVIKGAKYCDACGARLDWEEFEK